MREQDRAQASCLFIGAAFWSLFSLSVPLFVWIFGGDAVNTLLVMQGIGMIGGAIGTAVVMPKEKTSPTILGTPGKGKP